MLAPDGIVENLAENARQQKAVDTRFLAKFNDPRQQFFLACDIANRVNAPAFNAPISSTTARRRARSSTSRESSESSCSRSFCSSGVNCGRSYAISDGLSQPAPPGNAESVDDIDRRGG